MSWKQIVRRMEADRRRSARHEARWTRELERRQKELAKQAARDDAAREAAEFDAYIGMIVSLHRECGDAWDWRALAKAAQPAPPERSTTRESAARAAADAYSPGFFDRVFGGAARHAANLEAAVRSAAEEDEAAYEAARRDHQERVSAWRERKAIGAGVVAQDPASYRRAIEHVDPFGAVTALGSTVTIEAVEPDVLALRCEIGDDELIPREELKLTSAGKLSTKNIPEGRYQALYQDHVCSCAIRIARETFALLPVKRAIVTVAEARRLDTSTGRSGPATILTVHFLRSALSGLNYSALDASDSMKNFQHRMRFKKTTGFERVEPITIDENWITT